MIDKFPITKRHESMRGYFSYALFKEMEKDNDIWLIVGDLGWGIFDNHFKYFPERCINTGAAEVAACDISVGLALEGKKPFFYSITTFGLYRPFECIRNYINHEKIAVKLCMSGRDKDYAHDGWSHDATEVSEVMKLFPNIQCAWPDEKELIPEIVERMVQYDKPYFLSLRR